MAVKILVQCSISILTPSVAQELFKQAEMYFRFGQIFKFLDFCVQTCAQNIQNLRWDLGLNISYRNTIYTVEETGALQVILVHKTEGQMVKAGSPERTGVKIPDQC